VRCAGSKGCKKTWTYPRARGRIFTHAQDCAYLGPTLQAQARNEKAKGSAGPRASILSSNGRTDTEDDAQDSLRVVKRAKTEPAIASSSNQGTGNSMLATFVKTGRKELKNNADHALLLFITCNGIPPSVINSREFKRFCSTLNTSYDPPSETTLSEKLIPAEAANIHCAVIQYLQTRQDLTITFDGGKLRGSKGLYSVHVSTPERRTFCMTLDDASRISHTGDYIYELLLQVSQIHLKLSGHRLMCTHRILTQLVQMHFLRFALTMQVIV
jgi:hypothetical protein